IVSSMVAADYYDEVKALVAQFQSAGKNVGLVDQPDARNNVGLVDQPDAELEKNIADVWFDAIHAIVSQGRFIAKNPTPPGLEAELFEELKAELSWETSTDNIGVDHYEIYQNEALIGEVP